jgi:hypothetical protein
MDVMCKFVFQFPDSESALKIKNTLDVDNYSFIRTEVKENTLVADISSKSVMSLLHTIEDYLSCLSTAESILTK